MARKKWSAHTEITPSLLKFREKRKWQIALRRYVLLRKPCKSYAPYFGLDIENLRKWFEMQFEPTISWEDFGKSWQFDHIIPVTYFDFSLDAELRICWNFINLRVEELHPGKNSSHRLDILAAKAHFEELYKKTTYTPCAGLLKKIELIEQSVQVSTARQQSFILENQNYLGMIEGYSEFEFELLNSGRSIAEIQKEIEFLRKFEK